LFMSVDLSIDICGVGLKNPFILSSATPTKTAKNIKKGIDSGWAGAVMKTLVPFDYAREYADAGTMIVTPRVMEVALVSTVVELLKEVGELQGRLNELEKGVQEKGTG